MIKIIIGIPFILALVFIPAGTLNWPEAWLYLAINVSYFVPTLLYLKKHSPELIKRRTTKFIPEQGWDKAINLLIVVFCLALFVITGFEAVRYSWTVVPVELKTLGFIGITFSFVILFLVMKENPFLFRIVKVEKGHKVVTTGPYSIVRHPMYLAVIIQFTCIPLALGSFYGVIPAILVDMFIIIRTIFEEKTLFQELKGYKEYAQKTRYRLLPGVW